MKKILIANRGEVAVRVARAAHDLGLECCAVFSTDDARSPHVRSSDEAHALDASGPAAYLDIEAMVGAARAHGCDGVHPGYGYLSERADFARACQAAGLRFIGPTPQQLELLGDKAAARALAERCGIPLLPGSPHAVSLAEARSFFDEQRGAGVMIKALHGGGGRGMRAVRSAADLEPAYERCTSEARSAFGDGAVYVERLMRDARHIEVQVIGDGREVVALGARDCSLQRRFQKLIEIAPSPLLDADLRERLVDAALTMARQVAYEGLGTFEFLVDPSPSAELPFVFMEANPRLQVEHTITEEVFGIDLVQAQIEVAAGRTLAELGLRSDDPPRPRGFAVQFRLNAETIDAQGRARPSSGTIHRFDLPSGPGVRIDTFGRTGYAPSPQHDSLLAKLVVSTRGSSWPELVRRARRALQECRVEGIDTNLSLLRAIAARPEFESQLVHTQFVEEHLEALTAAAAALQAAETTQTLRTADVRQPTQAAPPSQPSLTTQPSQTTQPAQAAQPSRTTQPTQAAQATQATRAAQPTHAAQTATVRTADGLDGPPWDAALLPVRTPMPSRLIELNVRPGDTVRSGQQLAVLESMKMQHLVTAETPGRVVELRGEVGAFIDEGGLLMLLAPHDGEAASEVGAQAQDLDHIRPDLRRVIDRHAFGLDANRPEAVAKRHGTGGRTARENVEDLCDAGSFIEYGALAIAAQTRRRSLDDLVRNTPADGMIAGLGTVNAADFGPDASRCAVMAYDYTVLAGTQGMRNHHKKDRLLSLVHQLERPVVLFAEGGGGRPGDVDMPIVAGLNNHTFSQFAALSGKVPVVGIVNGRCFAGNAALLGCTDVIIATQASNIGMGGPAMVEGGGIGTFKPEDIGPSAVQHRNGVIDVLVDDEAAAVQAARHYLSFFQGTLAAWTCDDPRALRHAVPENRLRVYDVRAVLRGLFDTGSLLELRRGFGVGIVTGLARIEGRPVGVMANDPTHLGGAIDADAADKAARFMQLCNAHGLPIVSLCDTPGFMVGPDIEARAQVRHVCRMFVVASHLDVPFFAVVLRKGYGLGAQAMTAGGFDAPVFTVAWPSGEFGAMGLEGAVRLGFRKELEARPEGVERDALFRELVARQYENGSALNMAATLEIDAVIDPAETRSWLLRGLSSAASMPRRAARRMVDPW